jgi:hypothetical protein
MTFSTARITNYGNFLLSLHTAWLSDTYIYLRRLRGVIQIAVLSPLALACVFQPHQKVIKLKIHLLRGWIRVPFLFLRILVMRVRKISIAAFASDCLGRA